MTKGEPETLDKYKQAVWDFILEHCDVLESGTLFVKFHTSGRADLEKRIRARWLHNYHRENPQEKEQRAKELATAAQARKSEKRKRYERNKRKGRRKLTLKKMLKLFTFGTFEIKK